MGRLHAVWAIEHNDREFEYRAPKYRFMCCCCCCGIHIKHASCLVLCLNIVLIFYHIGALFIGELDVWKILFIPLECLSCIVLFCGLIIELKNSLLPFLFLQGLKIFLIGNNLYSGIEGMFDWNSDRMVEARQTLKDAGNENYNDRKLARINYGAYLVANYGTGIIYHLIFFYIVWRCRRYFADLGHVPVKNTEMDGKTNEAMA